MIGRGQYNAVVIGTSAGGLYALTALLADLPEAYNLPVIIVQHRARDQRDLLEEVLQTKCTIKVRQADEKEEICPGNVYIAPPDYHLLIESNNTFSLSADEAVLFSRPSIDVLFQSAAAVYSKKLVGIILTGANSDGAAGIATIRKKGGLTIAQDPHEAQFPFMPQAAINTGQVQSVLTLKNIHDFLMTLPNPIR